MKTKPKKAWWLDRLFVELAVAAFGALILDLHARLVELERRRNLQPVIPIRPIEEDEPEENGKDVSDAKV